MRWLKRVGWWLRGRLDGHSVQWNVDEDIRTHIELDAERLRAEGMEAAEALREAERRFGDRKRVRAEMMHIAAGPRGRVAGLSVGRGWTHVRHAGRSLRATPGPTALVVGTLAAAVGVATLMVTLSRTVLLGMGGVEDAAHVVSFHTLYAQLPEGMQQQPLHGSWVADMSRMDGVASMAAFQSGYFNLTGRGDPRRLDGLFATPRLFDVAGVHPMLGPGFARDATGVEKQVVVSWRVWKGALGGDPGAVGSTLVLNDEPYEVVGVMPDGFSFPRAEDVPATFRFPARPDVWVPFVPPVRGPAELGVVARLRPGVSAASLQPRLDALVAELAKRYGRDPGFSFRAVELREQAVGKVRPALLMLLLATGLLILVAMANVTGVGVARSEARLGDLAVRMALGAGRRGVASYLAAESLVLGTLAGAGGIGVAMVLAALVRRAAPPGIPDIDQVHVGLPAAGLAVVLAMAGAACLALGPVGRMLGWRMVDALRGQRSTASPSARRAGNAVVALEVAATLVLLAGASVLTRSVLHLLAVDPGFDTAGVMTAEITLPEATYPEKARAAAVQSATWPMPEGAAVPRFQRQVVQGLEARPGIAAAAFADPLPFSGTQEASVFWAEGMADPAEPPFTEYTVVTEDYFRAMGIRVIEGREFDGGESATSEPVAVVSQSLAAQFPVGRALGSRIKLGGRPDAPYPWLRVVGVVADVKRTDLTTPARPEMYVHIAQGGYSPQSTARLVVRVKDGLTPETALATMRAVVSELDPDVPVNAPASMRSLMANAAARARFTASLTVAFSLLALLITAMGLYSVISFSAATRRRELALRTVMGATGASIATSVLRETLRALALGLAAGVAGALLSARALTSLVFGVSPLEPLSLVFSVAVLSVVVALAAQGPVRACLRLDPARILSRD